MKLLIDSDFLYGSFNTNDAHHITSVALFKKYKYSGASFYVLNLVLQEVGTLLSHRVGMDAVRHFQREIALLGVNTINVEESTEKAAWELFLKQTKKGSSFVDCANLAVIEKYNLDGILSFDSFYPKNLRKT